MYPEIVRIEINNEIDGFERTVINRLLPCFDSIEIEALERKNSFLENKSKKFDPDRDNEGCIEEDGYFEELNHIFTESALKQDYINSSATQLFHLFERQKKRFLGSDQTDIIKPKLAQIGYDLDSCPHWMALNKELRDAANAIKHGSESNAAKKLKSNFPHLLADKSVCLSKSDIERYIQNLRNFWRLALNGQVDS
ncbi:hypothetical protein LX59_02258 [Azomonas agilis]|uniref:RiboL-PSP-HEPN domain-containing protein n=1 Tax=Azomonas agilis TaxID=116849 RepID=A0A562I1M8_9GAMM|nr:hypothetical protein [Azomonas agilis]TWH64588.1 hypothetical protein LX59_02258 [Azomonas agilis]